ncbi:hypothetical protein V5799_016963 [Amblyomma americanum]|uniref:Methyltransferase type 11 domain-containing protein n=1 Tax=Amblyomma americanum TaxID=6943 RepID=A0AAQ4F3G6_AMBAM
MVEFARKNSAHENIMFDVFDFCREDAGNLVARYGRFNRIYSFLTFHYVKDERKAFKELARLLTPNSGECLITAAVSTAPFDAWLELYLMKRWANLIPDPRSQFSKQFSFHFRKSKTQVESDIRLMASEAGLKCIALHVYDTEWRFPNVDICADSMVEALDFNKYISQADIGDFKADMARALNGARVEKDSEYFMKSIIYCLHAQSASL